MMARVSKTSHLLFVETFAYRVTLHGSSVPFFFSFNKVSLSNAGGGIGM